MYFTRSNKIFVTLGLIVVCASVGSYFFSQSLMKSQIQQNVYVLNNSKAYGFWTNPPAKIYRNYYLFSVQNPEEAASGTQKPILLEMGPYTYAEVWEKKNVNFIGTEFVSFEPVVTLHFEPTLSKGSLSDNITFVNVPAAGMIETSMHSKSKSIVPEMVNLILNGFGTKLFITKTVGELITGYKDPLLTLAQTFLPNLIKSNEFSIINGKNGTTWQNYTMMTGYDSIQNVAKIVSWDGMEKLDLYDAPGANLINGTDGTFYPPFRTRDQVMYAYNSDMCRSYKLVYLKDAVVDDIDVYQFHLPQNIFYNASSNPDNFGFCNENDCLGNGVMNISKCYGGVSGFISQPHFLNADKQFTDSFVGLNPNESRHDFILNFEPTSGVPIQGNIKFQISFYIFQNDKIDIVKNVKPALYPLVWFDESLELFPDTRTQLKQVALIAQLVIIIPIVLFALGVFTVTVNLTIVLIRHLKRRPTDEEHEEINEKTHLINSKLSEDSRYNKDLEN